MWLCVAFVFMPFLSSFFLLFSLLFRYRPPDYDYHWLALLLHVCWCAVLQWVLRAPWHYNCVKQFKRRKHKSIPVHLHLAIQKRIYWLTCWAQYNRQVSLSFCFGTITSSSTAYSSCACSSMSHTNKTNKQTNKQSIHHMLSPPLIANILFEINFSYLYSFGCIILGALEM